jgi:nitrous oxidase accessory protein NosD
VTVEPDAPQQCAAMAAASPGDIVVLTVTCAGHLPVDTNSTLDGKPGETLDGAGMEPTATISPTTAIVAHLRITGGNGSCPSPGCLDGGGIANPGGSLMILHSTITGDIAVDVDGSPT